MDKYGKGEIMISFEQWAAAEKIASEKPMIKSGDRPAWFSHVQPDFAFRCIGQSMRPTFIEGDLVFIHQQDTFSDGQIAAVQIGKLRTLKRLYKLSNGLRLCPDNQLFDPVDLIGEDAAQVRIIGVAVARK